jgi:hypothetical protein
VNLKTSVAVKNTRSSFDKLRTNGCSESRPPKVIPFALSSPRSGRVEGQGTLPQRFFWMNHRHLFLLGIALLGATQAIAQAEADAAYGRLFFSPERRAALDRQRALNIQEVSTAQGETLQIDGIVQRSGGKRTTWINGRPQTEAEEGMSGIGIRIDPRNPGRVRVQAGDEGTTEMKVGEAVNRTTGERDTRLGGGTVRRHSPQ